MKPYTLVAVFISFVMICCFLAGYWNGAKFGSKAASEAAATNSMDQIIDSLPDTFYTANLLIARGAERSGKSRELLELTTPWAKHQLEKLERLQQLRKEK